MMIFDRCSMLKLRAAATLASLMIFSLSGCGEKATYPVAGKVVLKGQADTKAVTGYLVTFESAEKHVSGVGQIQPDGTFTVTTFDDGDGAVPGKNQIAVTPPSIDSDMPRPASKIHSRYAEFSTSGLTAEIKSGKNEVTLELDPAEPAPTR